jgi:tRNA modification GTPase
MPPAGIAVIRLSGPQAGDALARVVGGLPAPRIAKLCRFVDPDSGDVLDTGLALWFPGPKSVTGEDLAECHIHGGRAVVAAILSALGRLDGLRPALAGEFTRRAFENGRIDLSEAEGLADLLAAETESQRQSALALAEGGLGRLVAAWQSELLMIAAQVEAELDFSDEGDVPEGYTRLRLEPLSKLEGEIAGHLAAPTAERLNDGVRVVLAGPPNAGKSSLFNRLAERDAAIVSEIAGTTRDRIEAPVALHGVPLLLIDTAGLRAHAGDEIEAIGMSRAEDAMSSADIILWLGKAGDAPEGAILIAAKADLGGDEPGLRVSARTGNGLGDLKVELLRRARALLPKLGALALKQRHRSILAEVRTELSSASEADDPLIIAEHLRAARNHLNRLTGKAGVEDMLDALFGAMCIGK